MSEADFAAVLRDIRAQLDRIEALVDALENMPDAIADAFKRAAAGEQNHLEPQQPGAAGE